MNPLTRRCFLGAAGTAAASSLAPTARAIEPLERINPRFTGLSLTSYSLKRHMRWWWGKPAKGRLDMLGFLEYCARLGLDGAELTSYFFETPVKRETINQIKRRAHLLGLDVTGAAMGNNFGHPPTSDVTRREMKYFQTWIDHFADLGAPVARVFASKQTPDGATDEQVLANVVANLQTALAHAERRGVMLGLENHDFVKNIDYLLRILKAIDSRWLGVIWDSANLAPTPDPYAELARIAPHAIIAQVKVMTRVNGEDVPADFARLVNILRKARYSGYLVFEYEESEDPYKAIPGYVKQLRGLIA
ncbi:MAG: sugar phosphate isomerase/epimerase [Planctomycetales bacterium]